MANVLSTLNALNEAAYLAGIFNWQMSNATYINPNNSQVSMMVVSNQQVPLEQYVSGAINTFNLITGAGSDPNLSLFNTSLSGISIRENIIRKHAFNRVPLANYDVPVDIGMGGQRISLNLIFAGTMYLTAFINCIQVLFNNETAGLGTLLHPFYNKINNVLPIEVNNSYVSESMNCIVCEIAFLTSDITHLSPANISSTIMSEISTYYIGVQNAVGSIAGSIAGTRAIASNIGAQL